MSNEGKPHLFYACSGAADVGQIADLTARQLVKEKLGAMSCLAGVGAGLPGFLESAQSADNIVIDGCPVSCGRKMFEQHNLPVTEIILTQHGLMKGSTPPTPDVVTRMVETVTAALAGR
jgi:uncharacterized metal-binding protein